MRAAQPIGRRHPVDHVVLRALEPLLGRFTARRALKLAAEHVGWGSHDLGPDDVAPICEFLRPMLRTLVGARPTESVLIRIRQDATGGKP